MSTVRVDLLRAHGTTRRYHSGCHCPLCRSANAEYGSRYRAANPEKEAESKRRYREANPGQAAETHRIYRAAHLEEEAEWKRRYRAENPEKVAESGLQWRTKNPEYLRDYRAAHRDELAEYDRDYWATHPIERAAYSRARKARERGNGGTHTAADIRAQYARQGGKCFWGRKVNPDCAVSLKHGYHVDHVTPLVKKGSNGTENIVLACPSCNLRKHAKHPMDFAGVML